MHFPSITALAILSIASTVLTNPIYEQDAVVKREEALVARLDAALAERQGCPICCCNGENGGCNPYCWRDEDNVVQWDVGKNETTAALMQRALAERQGCPICCCNGDNGPCNPYCF